jgi:flagellar P-ring protein precursor FlgI
MNPVPHRIWILAALLTLAWLSPAQAIRIKDVAGIKGVRPNQLVGYGLVVGLGGTGDDDKTQFTNQSLANMLEKMGIVVDPSEVDIDNIAAVMVTAQLPAFAKVGKQLDVTVSSIGNAKTLQGGTLLMTPLEGPDGQVYAVAQGPLSIGGFEVKGASGSTIQKNHTLAGTIPGGAIVEREIAFELAGRQSLELILKQPDFTTSLRMADSIAAVFQASRARAVDAGTVAVDVPEAFAHNLVHYIAEIEKIEIMPDSVARVVLNERTGTIVMGENVRIATVAISHGNLSIIIKEQPAVSQPLPFSAGETVVVPQTEIVVQEEKANLSVMRAGASIGEVVRGLNAIGVSPRDLIAIVQAIKAAGALHADVQII